MSEQQYDSFQGDQDQDQDHSLLESEISRRDVLKAVGVGAAVTAAGMAAPATVLGSVASAAGHIREFHGAYPYQAPPTGHFNVFSSDGNAIPSGLGIYEDLILMPLAKFNWASQTYVPYMATSWKFVMPATFIVNLRRGARWSDGSEFTSQDVMTTFSLGRLQGWSVWNYLDKVTAPDKYTVVFHMSKPASVVQRYVLDQNGTTNIVPDSQFGKFARQVEALVASGKSVTASSEGKNLRLNLDQYRPPVIVASGPFMFDPSIPISNGQLTLVKNPMSWAAKQVKFDRIVIFNGETPAVTPLVLQKQVDYATHGFPPATERQFVAQGVHILRPPIYSGPALYINYAKVPALAAKEVRQAITYAINRDQNAVVSLGASAKRQEYMSGISDNIVTLWADKGTLNNLNHYPYNPTLAAQLLTKRGFKKGSDGVWVTPAGTKMEYTLEVPAEYADWSAAASNLAEQLTKFGIKTTVRAVTFTQVPQDIHHGKFELAIQGWGAGSPFPQFSWANDITNNLPPVIEGPGIAYSLLQNGVDVKAMITATGQGFDAASKKAAVSRMARFFNENLPIIPLWERYGNNPSLRGVRVTGWPPDSDPIYRNSPYSDSFVVMMIVSGQLRGV